MHRGNGAAAPTCHLYTQRLGDTCGAKLTHHTHTAPGDLCVHLCVCMVHTQPLGTPDVGQVLSGILRPVRGFQTLLIGGSLLALVLTTDHDLGQYGTEVCSKNTTGEHCALVLCCEAHGRVRGGVEYLGPIIVPALGLPSTDRSVSINWATWPANT